MPALHFAMVCVLTQAGEALCLVKAHRKERMRQKGSLLRLFQQEREESQIQDSHEFKIRNSRFTLLLVPQFKIHRIQDKD